MTNPSTAVDAASAEPTHPCVRCGRPVPLDVAMCETCNPLGLKQPATSQVHGTVALGIVLAVVALAVLGKWSLSGVGPFDAQVANVAPAPDALVVTISARNAGTSAGTTSCRVTDPAREGVGPAAFVISPLIRAGATVTFSETITEFGSTPLTLRVDCQSP